MSKSKLVKEEMEVTKEINELGLAVKAIMEVTVKALDDGFQPSKDIPSVLLGSYRQLTKAVEGMDKMDDELKDDAIKAAMGALIPIMEGIEIVLKRKKEGKGFVEGNEVSIKK